MMEQCAGTVEMPNDWSREHDHYLYGTQAVLGRLISAAGGPDIPRYLLRAGAPQLEGCGPSACGLALAAGKRAAEVVTTEAVLIEVANALSGTARLRQLAAALLHRSYTEPNMTVVPLTPRCSGARSWRTHGGQL